MKNSYIALPEDKGKRIDSFLVNFLPQFISKEYLDILTRSQIVKISPEFVTINEGVLRKGYKLKVGDEIVIDLTGLQSTLESIIERKGDLKSSLGALHIVEETDDYIVVIKPKGLVVHPGEGNWEGTLANIVKGYLESKGEYDSRVDRGGIVHRLDKGVSGLMIIAKSFQMQTYLKEEFEQRRVVKIYRASIEEISHNSVDLPLVDSYKGALKALKENNYIPDDSWYRLEGYVGRDIRDRHKMRFSIVKENDSYKYSLSYIKRVSLSDCLIKIETGRMHQIRTSLRYLGYGIVGDTKYGRSSTRQGEGIELESVFLSLNLQNGMQKSWSV